MADQKKYGGAALALLLLAGVAFALGRKPEEEPPPDGPEPPPEPPPETFTFSLRIKNAPSGTAFWVTHWSFLGAAETWWFYGALPSAWYLRVGFLNPSYGCPAGDPSCQGIDAWFAPNQGKNYVLDCSTLQISEDTGPPPEPPPEPPSSVPEFIGASYPAQIVRAYIGPDGEPVRPRYDTSITLWLPHPWQGLQPYYSVSVVVENGDRYPPYIFSGGAIPVGYYNSGGALDAVLDGDGVYTLHSSVGLGSSSTPGIWPVRAKVFASQIVGDPSYWEFTVPQQNYDLGIIGEVEIV